MSAKNSNIYSYLHRTNIDQHLAHTIVITSLYWQLPQTSLNANQLQAIPELTSQGNGKHVNSLTGLTEITLNTIYTQLQEPFLSTSNCILIFKRTKLTDATRQEIPNEAKEILRHNLEKMHKILYYTIFQHKSYHICCAVVSMRPMALNHMIGPSSSGKGDEVNPKQVYTNPT